MFSFLFLSFLFRVFCQKVRRKLKKAIMKILEICHIVLKLLCMCVCGCTCICIFLFFFEVQLVIISIILDAAENFGVIL